MRYAITPGQVGKPVGFRLIEDDWPLVDGETFTVDASVDVENAVLASDGVSVRPSTDTDRVDGAKAAQLALIEKQRLAGIEGGTVELDGVTYSTNDGFVTDLVQAITLIGAAQALNAKDAARLPAAIPSAIPVSDVNGTPVMLAYNDIVVLAGMASFHKLALLQAAQAAEARINAATTVHDVVVVDLEVL